jgi:hypothetical protein
MGKRQVQFDQRTTLGTLKQEVERLTLPRFYRHPHKGENGEIGGDHASKHSTSVYRGI